MEESSRMGGIFKIKSCKEKLKNLGVLDEVFREIESCFCVAKELMYQRAGFVSYDFKEQNKKDLAEFPLYWKKCFEGNKGEQVKLLRGDPGLSRETC